MRACMHACVFSVKGSLFRFFVFLVSFLSLCKETRRSEGFTALEHPSFHFHLVLKPGENSMCE